MKTMINLKVVLITMILFIGIYFFGGCSSTNQYGESPPSDEIADIDELLGLDEEEQEIIEEDDILKLLGVTTEEDESGTAQSDTMPYSEDQTQQFEASDTQIAFRDEQSASDQSYSSTTESNQTGNVPLSTSGGTIGGDDFYYQYQEARQAYKSKNYDEAIQQFETLLVNDTQHTLSDNCQYWVGESYYAKGNYQQAILSFEKVFTFPQSNKNDASQLKLGLSYMRLNEISKAKEELQKLIDEYPTSEYVSIAQRFIDQIETGISP